MKIFIFTRLFGLFVLLLFSGCGKKTEPIESESFKIGVFLLASHPVIFDLQEGFGDELNRLAGEGGYTVEWDVKNAEGEGALLNQLASYFTRGDHDLVYSVGAPATLRVKAMDPTTPILFAGVPDPVRNGFVESLERPGTGITGARFLPPADLLLDLASASISGFDKVAVLRNPGEVNSASTAEPLIAEAKERGLGVGDFGVTEISQLNPVLNRIVSEGYPAIFIPTDNLIYQNLDRVIAVANENKIPVFSVTDVAVKKGALFSVGIPYYDVGVITAGMAERILREGLSANDIPVLDIQEGRIFVQPEVAKTFRALATEDFPVAIVE